MRGSSSSDSAPTSITTSSSISFNQPQWAASPSGFLVPTGFQASTQFTAQFASSTKSSVMTHASMEINMSAGAALQQQQQQAKPEPYDPRDMDSMLNDGKGEMKYQAEFDWTHYSTPPGFPRPTKSGSKTVLSSSSFKRLFCKIIRCLNLVEFHSRGIDILSSFHEEIPGVKVLDSDSLKESSPSEQFAIIRRAAASLQDTYFPRMKVFGELDQLKRLHVGRVGKKSVLETLSMCPCSLKISGIWDTEFKLPKEVPICICKDRMVEESSPIASPDVKNLPSSGKSTRKGQLKRRKSTKSESTKSEVTTSNFSRQVLHDSDLKAVFNINHQLYMRSLKDQDYFLTIRFGNTKNEYERYSHKVKLHKAFEFPVRISLLCRVKMDLTNYDHISFSLAIASGERVFSLRTGLLEENKGMELQPMLFNLSDCSVRMIIEEEVKDSGEYTVSFDILKKLCSQWFCFALSHCK